MFGGNWRPAAARGGLHDPARRRRRLRFERELRVMERRRAMTTKTNGVEAGDRRELPLQRACHAQAAWFSGLAPGSDAFTVDRRKSDVRAESLTRNIR